MGTLTFCGCVDWTACQGESSAVEGDQSFTHCNLYSTVGSKDQPQHVLYMVNPRQSMNSIIGSHPHANPIVSCTWIYSSSEANSPYVILLDIC